MVNLCIRYAWGINKKKKSLENAIAGASKREGLGLLVSAAGYPPDEHYDAGDCKDRNDPDQYRNHRANHVVEVPACDGGVPVAVHIDLKGEGDEEQR